MASVRRRSNKPLSNVHQYFDDLPDNRVKLQALPVDTPQERHAQADHLKSHKEVVSQVSGSEVDSRIPVCGRRSLIPGHWGVKEAEAALQDRVCRQATQLALVTRLTG